MAFFSPDKDYKLELDRTWYVDAYAESFCPGDFRTNTSIFVCIIETQQITKKEVISH